MPDITADVPTPNHLELKRSEAAISLAGDQSASHGQFSGYAAVFGSVDRDGDLLTEQTFAESLAGIDASRLPPLLWQHDPSAPIGRFSSITIDKNGLFVEAELGGVGKALEAYELLKLKALDGLSVGFITREAVRDPATGVRTVTKADLAEISLVTFPAHQDARIGVVKNAMPGIERKRPSFLDTKCAFERFLRASGASRREARGIVAKGYRGLVPLAESIDDKKQIEQMVADLKVAAEIRSNRGRLS